jgi:hypothetical protein
MYVDLSWRRQLRHMFWRSTFRPDFNTHYVRTKQLYNLQSKLIQKRLLPQHHLRLSHTHIALLLLLPIFIYVFLLLTSSSSSSPTSSTSFLLLLLLLLLPFLLPLPPFILFHRSPHLLLFPLFLLLPPLQSLPFLFFTTRLTAFIHHIVSHFILQMLANGTYSCRWILFLLDKRSKCRTCNVVASIIYSLIHPFSWTVHWFLVFSFLHAFKLRFFPPTVLMWLRHPF